MPVRRFHCPTCEASWCSMVRPDEHESFCEVCKAVVKSSLPRNAAAPEVTERVNNYWNKNLKRDSKKQLEERSQEHMRTYEMPEIVAKFGMKTLKNHPLIKNGRIRKKGEA